MATTPLPTTSVMNTMKLFPFCDKSNDNPQQYLHGDSIHLHIHYYNTNLQQTRDASNVDIVIALKNLCALFLHTPYLRSSECVQFQAFLNIPSINTTKILDTTPRSMTPTILFHIATLPRNHVLTVVSPLSCQHGTGSTRR